MGKERNGNSIKDSWKTNAVASFTYSLHFPTYDRDMNEVSQDEPAWPRATEERLMYPGCHNLARRHEILVLKVLFFTFHRQHPPAPARELPGEK